MIARNLRIPVGHLFFGTAKTAVFLECILEAHKALLLKFLISDIDIIRIFLAHIICEVCLKIEARNTTVHRVKTFLNLTLVLASSIICKTQ